MSERMTDERLDEIEASDSPLKQTEIWQAMKAERAEVARLKDAIREHRDSFSKDMDEHDWTTEDEALWELIDEKKPPGGLGG